MWNDEKFLQLSAPPPNGQTLWQRLLTGPELTNIPGCFQAWDVGLARALRWPLEGFLEAFREVESKGMAKADWEVGFVWVPNSLVHNKPESPNVVRSWRATWEILPECSLKNEAYRSLKESIKIIGEAYQQAFNEAFSGNPFRPSLNQEQEQEQEQEQYRQPKKPRVRKSPGREGGETPYPEGLAPTAEHLARCKRDSLDVSRELEKFKNNALAKGLVYKNWNAAFTTWLMNAVEFRARNGRGIPATDPKDDTGGYGNSKDWLL
jgi:hypothetical protein